MRLIEQIPDDPPVSVSTGDALNGWRRAFDHLYADPSGGHKYPRGYRAAIGLLASEDSSEVLIPAAMCGDPAAPNRVVLCGIAGQYLHAGQLIAYNLRRGVCVIMTETPSGVPQAEALATVLTDGDPSRLVLIEPDDVASDVQTALGGRVASRNVQLAGKDEIRFHVVDADALAARQVSRKPNLESKSPAQVLASDAIACVEDVLDSSPEIVAEGWRAGPQQLRVAELWRRAAELRRLGIAHSGMDLVYRARVGLSSPRGKSGLTVPTAVCGEVKSPNIIVLAGDALELLETGEMIASLLQGQGCVNVADVPTTGDDIAVLAAEAMVNDPARVVLLDPGDLVGETTRRMFGDRVRDLGRGPARREKRSAEFVVLGSAELEPYRKFDTYTAETAVDCLLAVIAAGDGDDSPAARNTVTHGQMSSPVRRAASHPKRTRK